jgi:hypothetical protein
VIFRQFVNLSKEYYALKNLIFYDPAKRRVVIALFMLCVGREKYKHVCVCDKR